MTIADRYPLAYRAYPYARAADQDRTEPARHPVVVVGGGPVGMACALDLGLRGTPVLVLDDHEGIATGSRAICFSKRSLEIAHRLGCAQPMTDKGVVWNIGKVFHGDRKVYEFNLLPEDGHRHPAFINLQQPYFEKCLVDRIREAQTGGAPIEIRGRNRVEAIDTQADHALLDVMTPEGPYRIAADWVVACDGAGSPLRKMLGMSFEGQVFRDSFLIADVRIRDMAFPTERWFWFDPPSKSGASQLLHRQPDDTWRIDFQIGWDVDRAEELKEDNVRRRVRDMLGADVAFDLVWTSIYTFQCRRMTRFRKDRVIFAGDSAHQVSPFGARGANSGIQDADNLAWKLHLVLTGKAPETLLDSYEAERIEAADENILNSTRATDFISPKSAMSRLFRDAVLDLAEHHDFARPLVNSGRLSVPCTHEASPLNTPDALPDAPARARPGSTAPDAGIDGGFLLDRLGGGFRLLCIGCEGPDPDALQGAELTALHLPPDGALAERYLGAEPAAVYLVRPDQIIAARWTQAAADAAAVAAALSRATGQEGIA